MRFLRSKIGHAEESIEDDPIAGVAQLFDVSIAFIVAVIGALFTLLSGSDLLKKDSEWTLTRKDKNGEMEVLEKKDNQIISSKLTGKQQSGNGVRLGTAYQLENGQVIYVPDEQVK
ncbi:DUF2149 domain-containing protein [Chitinophaga pendula]|uniref:DUF2149 domain-containing protein n=1 Tax=Chitinophaga TaxID=79328 RepID=UPI000BAFB536|nr:MULTISPECIES: DUF2149 domain-containing protein [Chitinophaga]ASZ12609.1 hypothetical protein CK934_17415 [Chitinophaga sp. MD30]UCJ09787.1 DUF2149 domain-containing protein [Chitinophaga pendula]